MEKFKMNKKEMSSFCMYRMLDPMHTDTMSKYYPNRKAIKTSVELESHLKNRVNEVCENVRVALALSGGIDSAILAKFMPKGSIAYPFKCIVPGIKVTDESPVARKYAEECELVHKVIEVYWGDFEKYASVCMKHKKAPIHSIEVQIYKAALQAKADGIDTLIFGEAADAIYGGLSGLLSQDWTIGEFINRYSLLMPYSVLRDCSLELEAV